MIGCQVYGTPSWAGAIVFIVFAVFCLALTVLCGLEAWLLVKGYAPITSFIRADIDHHRLITTAILVFIGMLLGHFWR